MNKYAKIVGFGILLWLIPFLVSFLFFDPSTQQLTIAETFFKTIMVVVGALVGVKLAVLYFKGVKKDYLEEGIVLGIAWLIINWTIDLVLVYTGFFNMAVGNYFTDIGLRYLVMPFYTVGMGYALKHKK